MIKLLDAAVYELIAAGEVVERPASAAKELVENSIDAGARSISVEIRRGGLDEMRITDDGCGIPCEELPRAFVRHATSKIATSEDLEDIHTLGFRGEALPSIAAVSRISFTSKPSAQTAAAVYSTEGGADGVTEVCGAPDGSCVCVRDIFYNTPARMKFLKSDAAEGAAIQDVVQQLSLAHPEIAFSFTRDGKQVFYTPGDNRLLSAVFAVFPRDTAANMLFVEAELGGVSVDGYVCKPAARRASRALQYAYVNGRFVKDKTIVAAVEQAFRSVAGGAGFPAFAVNVRLSADAVDVNVHPAKTQVRFSNEKSVFSAVYRAVKNALENESVLMPAGLEGLAETSTPDRSGNFAADAEASSRTDSGKTSVGAADAEFLHLSQSPRNDVNPFFSERELNASAPIASLMPNGAAESECDILTQAGSGLKADCDRLLDNIHTDSKTEDAAAQNETDVAANRFCENSFCEAPQAQRQAADAAAESQTVHFSTAEEEADAADTPADFSRQQSLFAQVDEALSHAQSEKKQLKYVGEVFSLYIIAQYGDTLVVIDKHAAHERLLYENIASLDVASQRQILLSPVIVELSPVQKQLCLDNSADMLRAGFSVEDFGGNSLAVREIPVFYRINAVEQAIEGFARQMEYGRSDLSDKNAVFLLRNIACRAAVKSGDECSSEELMEIARKILQSEIPKLCPHGRPVLYTMTKKELERRFDRS